MNKIFVYAIIIYQFLYWPCIADVNVDQYEPEVLNSLIEKLENARKDLSIRIRKIDPEETDTTLSNKYNSEICVQNIDQYVEEIVAMMKQLNLLVQLSDITVMTKLEFYFIPVVLIILLMGIAYYYVKEFYIANETEKFKDSVKDIQNYQNKISRDINKSLENIISKYSGDISKIYIDLNSVEDMMAIDEMMNDMKKADKLLKFKIKKCFEDINDKKMLKAAEKENEKKEIWKKLEKIKEFRNKTLRRLNLLSEYVENLSLKVNDINEAHQQLRNEDCNDFTSCELAFEDFTARMCSLEMKIAK
ncbi:uncharacterized protein [Centruroides vittatus]|uniref:uncharacterized protein n=1 Tax=Centruroides vittatus TaxID=120091 RepID=UPI00350F27DC